MNGANSCSVENVAITQMCVSPLSYENITVVLFSRRRDISLVNEITDENETSCLSFFPPFIFSQM